MTDDDSNSYGIVYTLDDLRRKQGVTQNFYKFLNEVFSAKLEENQGGCRPADSGKSLLNTSMSKNCLKLLGDILESEVLEVILRIIARSIENRSAYSNDMFHIAFDYEVKKLERLPKETWLFGMIEKTIRKILSDTTNKKDWFWMYVLLRGYLFYCNF